MALITLSWGGTDKIGVGRLVAAVDGLSSRKLTKALVRAVNHTGDKTFTQVKRALVKQMGLPNQALFKQGRSIRRIRAAGARPEYQIVTEGRAVRMKEFRWRKTARGISAYPWGKLHRFRSAFVVPRWSGNLYRRKTKARFPLEALYGPNLNKELVKDATAAAFHSTVATSLPSRLAHEIKVLTNGVVS